MDVGLAVAGLICVAMAVGHEAIGTVWVLPGLKEEEFPSTPFGRPPMTASMIRVTWHIVTIFAAATGTLLMTLAWMPDADPKTLVLRWFAVMWLIATVMAAWIAIGRVGSVRGLLRLPVPLLWVVVAVLLWRAAG